MVVEPPEREIHNFVQKGFNPPVPAGIVDQHYTSVMEDIQGSSRSNQFVVASLTESGFWDTTTRMR